VAALSRHIVDRLAALHFLAGLLDALSAPEKDGGLTTLCPEAQGAALKLRRQQVLCMELRHVANSVIAMNRRIDRVWGEEVDPRQAVMAGLAMVAEQRERLDAVYRDGKCRTPAMLEKRVRWGALEETLQKLLEILDPELEGVAVELGAQAGERLAQAARRAEI
jgi:hypothetical protein